MISIEEIFGDLADERFEAIADMPEIQEILGILECKESHDLKHHWPFHIDRQEEREDCIYCGITKRRVMGRIFRCLIGDKTGIPFSRPPKPGSFPRPDNGE